MGSRGGAQSGPAHQRWSRWDARWVQPPGPGHPLPPPGASPCRPSCTRQRAECSVPGGSLGGQGQDVLTLEQAGQPARRRLHSPKTEAGPEQGQEDLSHPREGAGEDGAG